ncbi:MAG TPA: diguanylate cyclase [Gallionella sp.]|nr:diguanylate cyclase [Gallionella sp.]
MKKVLNEQDSLRAAAEAKLARSHAPKQAQHPPEKILHELRVHQIELEMQSEQLLQLQIELKKSRDRYMDFYDLAPVGYLTLSHEEMIDKANLTGAALLGVERNKLQHHRFAPFVATEDRDRWHRHFQNVLTRDDPATCELVLQRRDGSRFFGQLDCLCLSKADKAPVVRIVLTDITERKRAEDAVRTQEEFFRMIAENVEDFLAVLDLEGRRLYNSLSYAKLFGSIEAIKGTDSFAEIHPDDRERVKQAFRETVRSGRSHRLSFRFVLADGSIHYMESCGALIRNSHGQALRVVVVSRDVTERIREENKIRNLAFYDALTQLPNRRLLNDRLDQAMAASKRSGRYGALLFLDLDNFKPLNDMHGHSVGDLLLVEVAHRITSCVREMDTVARFGGDEFVVVLSELNENKAESTVQAEIVAQKINAVLSEPYAATVQKDGKETMTIKHHCTSSIGVVMFINHEADADDLVKWADIAMYQAKEAGGNQVWFYDAKA